MHLFVGSFFLLAIGNVIMRTIPKFSSNPFHKGNDYPHPMHEGAQKSYNKKFRAFHSATFQCKRINFTILPLGVLFFITRLKSKNIDKQIAQKLIRVLATNPYVQIFRRLADLGPLDNYRVTLNASVELDQRVYNRSTTSKIRKTTNNSILLGML
ncbi:unnamed protein product [Lactuca virosa]|uniref:Uncharacterized protein n=1 Tax=Lactuca virosa TaxID=75947 RepID=A0AAU9NKP7_9ASTR|nr:unnamed protein product [Lactuca virosa]